MDRGEVLRWLEAHPSEVHGVPAEIVARCETAVRQHAAEDAWQAARSIVEGRMHEWEHRWGFNATEAGVAREVCSMLAGELKGREPHVERGDETHLAGGELLSTLEPEARERVSKWVCELAQDLEHRIWKEIVRFTRREARSMIRDGRVSDDRHWDATGNFAHRAAHIAELVLEDYDRNAP